MRRRSIGHHCSHARGCLRRSRPMFVFVAAAALAGGCSPRTLIAVDPDPCADGGRGPGCPDPCADGGVINALPGCVPPGLLDDLIGYWRLDDASGSTTARDWS